MALKPATLALRYAAFAAVAIAANVGAQYAILELHGGRLSLAIVIGTSAGLITKYVLDKRWIFFDRSGGLREHGRKFGLYTFTGVLTTLIFWGTELAFAMLTSDRRMVYVGALLGLCIGYGIKYRLDRHIVFRDVAT